MMKKLFILMALILIAHPVLAKTIHVQAMEEFSTENPPSVFSVKILEDLCADEFQAGDILEGKIVDIKNPKRMKRDAAFTFVPLKNIKANGESSDIKGYYPAKYTTTLNKAELAKHAALGVGNYFVKGLSMGYSAVEGAIKNEKDNRFKSSVNAVYEDSPFSYVEKGGDINIKEGETFLLNFKD